MRSATAPRGRRWRTVPYRLPAHRRLTSLYDGLKRQQKARPPQGQPVLSLDSRVVPGNHGAEHKPRMFFARRIRHGGG
jgi:hypothetical protein